MPEKIDWNFIGKLEGVGKTKAYVPNPKTSKSGVTIATGFDLGQRDESDLKSLKLDAKLIEKLKPYLGVTGVAAKALIDKNPLEILPEQAKAIDKAVKPAHVSKLKEAYNAAKNNKKKFFDLPGEAQTVIASVSFQYGVGLEKRTPKFWGYIVTQNWPAAVNELRNFGDDYKTRRKLEAALLERLVSKRPSEPAEPIVRSSAGSLNWLCVCETRRRAVFHVGLEATGRRQPQICPICSRRETCDCQTAPGSSSHMANYALGGRGSRLCPFCSLPRERK